jgi:hypothetical protein
MSNNLTDQDYVLTEGAAWLNVGLFAIRIHTTDEGVTVDIFDAALAKSDGNCDAGLLNTTYVYNSDIAEIAPTNTCSHCGRTLDDDQTQGVCSSDDCPRLELLSTAEEDILSSLRDRGCAVCVFQPHEIGDADLEKIEERMCVAGWDEISTNGNVGLTG